jgi:hypothetical protein
VLSFDEVVAAAKANNGWRVGSHGKLTNQHGQCVGGAAIEVKDALTGARIGFPSLSNLIAAKQATPYTCARIMSANDNKSYRYTVADSTGNVRTLRIKRETRSRDRAAILKEFGLTPAAVGTPAAAVGATA